MSLVHSPPRTPASAAQAPLTHCVSDTNISIAPKSSLLVPIISKEYAKSDPNVTHRKYKRKEEDLFTRNEVLEMFSTLRKEQDEKYTALMKEQNTKFSDLMNKVQSGINSHTEQNAGISSSIDFLSQKYDEMALKIINLEQEKSADRAYIKSLESRVDQLDRSLRSSSIEIRNVPKKAGESKEDLLKLVTNVGLALKVPVQPAQVRDVYRINTKSEKNQPIVAELSTVILRDKVIGSVKEYNKRYSTSKFSTSNLKIEGPTKPIFISESLTAQAKKLFFLAREFAKENGFKYCWASRGKIYIRKADGASPTRINNQDEIEKLKIK